MISKEKFAEYLRLVQTFEYEKAHEEFYHKKLIKHENEQAPTVGLLKHKEEMKAFLSSISEEKAALKQYLIGDGFSAVEWEYEFVHEDWGKRAFSQLSIQRWDKDKIVLERHHYQM
ncbi:MAG: hypothetical protein AAFY71_26170 [Bacteroidota bacterium]